MLAVPLCSADTATDSAPFWARSRPKPSREAALQLRALAAASGFHFTFDTSGSRCLPAQFAAGKTFLLG